MVSSLNTQIDIKQLDISYLRQLQIFHSTNFKNYYFSELSFKTFLTTPQYKTFAILSKTNNIIAYITFLLVLDEAEIIFIGVAKNFRKFGLASKLLNVPRGTFSISKIFLEVSVKNHDAIKLYQKNNFKILLIRKNYFSKSNFDIKDAFLMVKDFS